MALGSHASAIPFNAKDQNYIECSQVPVLLNLALDFQIYMQQVSMRLGSTNSYQLINQSEAEYIRAPLRSQDLVVCGACLDIHHVCFSGYSIHPANCSVYNRTVVQWASPGSGVREAAVFAGMVALFSSSQIPMGASSSPMKEKKMIPTGGQGKCVEVIISSCK